MMYFLQNDCKDSANECRIKLACYAECRLFSQKLLQRYKNSLNNEHAAWNI